MRRLPAAAFGLLVVATVGAFFLTQHLKVTNPFVFGDPAPTPAAINPVSGRARSCISSKGKPLDYRSSYLTISIGHPDSVGVYIVSAKNPSGNTVATISSGTPMQAGYFKTKNFTWNGHFDDGQVAPAGRYDFRIVLEREGRSYNVSTHPVQVITHPPTPRILSVTAVSDTAEKSSATTTSSSTATTTTSTTTGTATATATATTAVPGAPGGRPAAVVISPPTEGVKIRFTRAAHRRVWINVYRTDVSGKPPRVAHFAVNVAENPERDTAVWNGEIGGRPAPAGTYLVGITAQDEACDQVTYPATLPPAAGTTDGSGVSVRYLSATQPLAPIRAGSRATVSVDAAVSGYTWKLRRAGTRKVLASGSGPRGQSTIRVRLPKRVAGLYEVFLTAGSKTARVALVASETGRRGDRARVLVALPMLDWIGQSQVDDNGDGLPDTLAAGDAISLARPIVNGFPASFTDDVQLLKYLNSEHLNYQLTTDLALADQATLVDRWGVLLPDGSAYLPTALKDTLVQFVKHGGRVLALGTGTLAGTSRISAYTGPDPRAAAPVLSKTDMFGAEHGPVTSTDGELITELADQLDLFGDLTAFTGFSRYQPVEPPAGVIYSAAGIAERNAAIVAFPDGSGRVIEVGLPNFGATLADNVDSQELMSSVWPLLANQR